MLAKREDDDHRNVKIWDMRCGQVCGVWSGVREWSGVWGCGLMCGVWPGV